MLPDRDGKNGSQEIVGFSRCASGKAFLPGCAGIGDIALATQIIDYLGKIKR
jgi:hypothetical protein